MTDRTKSGFVPLLIASISTVGLLFQNLAAESKTSITNEAIRESFKKESIELNESALNEIRSNVLTANSDYCLNKLSGGSSKVGFASVEIATSLKLNTTTDSSIIPRVKRAIESLPCHTDPNPRCSALGSCINIPNETKDWSKYFTNTISLNNNSEFLNLVKEKQFSPVKISWEDIGRWEGSSWGDRISDVGIWVRENEADPNSAQLALSVRRDNNFRDKVLMVPSEKIKIHLKDGTNTREVNLKERLKELELHSETRDNNVIVSNQFAIVPVPSKEMNIPTKGDHPPRSAFTFSIYPYGSTNYVITDVIEGSSDAIVGPGTHQLLFANKNGKRAPFTASRAEDRKDLLKLESELKAAGMDVDVQRYYLIQIPLRKDAKGIQLSNMGTPPFRYIGTPFSLSSDGDTLGAIAGSAPSESVLRKSSQSEGLSKVAIGSGEAEGDYNTGAGYRGNRSEEPVRVTVIYFVTPIGEVTKKDMDNFTKAFESWDSKAIWGGSFVVKEG